MIKTFEKWEKLFLAVAAVVIKLTIHTVFN